MGDHSYLVAGDQCLFLREYTSRKGFSFSETNSQVNNLKKKRTDGGFHYKGPAIVRCGAEMLAGLNDKWLAIGTLVPIPPSKIKGDPLHDDRMLQVCREIAAKASVKVDVRELIVQKASTQAAHERADRPTVNEILANYEIDQALVKPAPTSIGLIDDVLTSGTHFKAAQRLLHQQFPMAKIYGIYWARRVFPNDEFDDLTALD